MTAELDEFVPFTSPIGQVIAFRLGLDTILTGMRAGVDIVGHIDCGRSRIMR